jgi:adenylate cyclase
MKEWLPGIVARLPVRIRVKLLGALLIIVGLLVAIGAAGLQSLGGVNRHVEDIGGLQRKVAAFRQLQHDTTWQLYSIGEALLSPDERVLSGVLRQLDHLRRDLDRVAYVSAGERELLERIGREHEHLVEVVTRVVGLIRDGKTAEGMEVRRREVAPIADRLERLTNEMINRAEAEMVEMVSASRQAYLTSKWVVAGFVFAGIGAALLLGFAISGSLIGPVKKMDAKLRQVASGDFSQRVEVANRDEMGDLAGNLNRMSGELARLYEELEVRNRFIRDAFGRYLSDEIVESILESPEGMKRGGEKRDVTIMLTDLRGFTALAESSEPEQVVRLLNGYLEVMVDVIEQFHGTISDITGDSLLVLFGAPGDLEDRARWAVTCAIAMQNAMAGVNSDNRSAGLPEIEMGVGLHDAAVIVGNIGSSKRLQYSVVGSGVNMASRIESFSVGGQVLVSQAVVDAAGDVLCIDGQRDVRPKGAEAALRVYEVGGIGAPHNLALEATEPAPAPLPRSIPVDCRLLLDKTITEDGFRGELVALSKKSAELVLDRPMELLSNLRLNLTGASEELAARDAYAKVMRHSSDGAAHYVIRFTSLPPEVAAYLAAHREYAAAPEEEAADRRLSAE